MWKLTYITKHSNRIYLHVWQDQGTEFSSQLLPDPSIDYMCTNSYMVL